MSEVSPPQGQADTRERDGVHRTRDDPSVVALVARARDGDKRAWHELVERYAPLVWSICRRYRLASRGLDIDDVGQAVWLRLVEQLGMLREPAALPGWLATTTRRECLRTLRGAQERERREAPKASGATGDGYPAGADDESRIVEEELVTAERDTALREAFAQLPPRCQRLLAMLIQDPPLPYAEISARLTMPIGSIGPNRARCLEKLRRCPALAAVIENEAERAGGDQQHG